MERNTYRIPAHYVSALVNDDYSGLSDADEIELNTWLKNVNPGYATCPDDEPFFSHNNDINNFGDNCYDVVFITTQPKSKFEINNPVMVINGPYRYHGVIIETRYRNDHGWNAWEYLVLENDAESKEWRRENQLI